MVASSPPQFPLTPWKDLRRVRLSGGTLEYHDAGAGLPVVLLHGLVMNHTLWDQTLPLLPRGFRYLRPVLPLGGHRLAMDHNADLSMDGLISLVAEFIEVLALEDVTLVVADWGGGLLLRSRRLDRAIRRLAVFPCEAFDNFPPGLPGRMAVLAGHLPGGIHLAARQLRIRPMRNSPLLLGQMAKRPITSTLIRSWTDGLVADPAVRRDLRRYVRSPLDKQALCQATQSLETFNGRAVVAWCPENKVMPLHHGERLSRLLRHSQLVHIDDSYALPMLDTPATTAQVLSSFLDDAVDDPPFVRTRWS